MTRDHYVMTHESDPLNLFIDLTPIENLTYTSSINIFFGFSDIYENRKSVNSFPMKITYPLTTLSNFLFSFVLFTIDAISVLLLMNQFIILSTILNPKIYPISVINTINLMSTNFTAVKIKICFLVMYDIKCNSQSISNADYLRTTRIRKEFFAKQMDQFYIEKLFKIKVSQYIQKEKHVQAAKRYENKKYALLQPFLQKFSSKSDLKADLCSILMKLQTRHALCNVANIIMSTLQPQNTSNICSTLYEKFGVCIKAFYTKFIHVTCLAHYSKRTAIFNKIYPELPNSPRSIITK
ncbi:hypothetical protein AGLY_015746 [Aphis glycines]|uniref:Uncharacterized protein n=1 Tax=Aphis glycines TaxID=307491 RepID=A0A6G0T0D2_APHGL|nr:hypothetical protein AGLY_015746 [Aphis glycines]